MCLIVALCVALDDKSVGVAEFDLDVAMVHSGQIPIEVVAIIQLTHIESRGESAVARGFQC